MADISEIILPNNNNYTIKDSYARSNYLPLTGGTLSGDLVIKDNDLDITITPSVDQYHPLFTYIDSNDNEIMNLTAINDINGRHGFSLSVYDQLTGDQNCIQLLQKADGSSPAMWLSQPGVWRSALGLGAAATKTVGSVSENNTGLVTGGDVYTAIQSSGAGNGVTGVKGNSESTYRTGQVNLSPSDIGVGLIGLKDSLTASDIPNLTMSKITSGVLPIEQGGTGGATAAVARTNLNVPSVQSQSTQNVGFYHMSGAAQMQGIYFNVTNANNTTNSGKRMALILNNSGLSMYNSTEETTIWGFTNMSQLWQVGSTTSKRYTIIPTVDSDGGMEIGKYIDFHSSNTDTSDYISRFIIESGTLYLVQTHNNVYTSLPIMGHEAAKSMTINSSNVTSIANNKVWRNASTVTLQLTDVKLKAQLANGSNVVIGTLPAGYRPPDSVYAQCDFCSTNVTGIYLRITNTGEVRVSARGGAAITTSALLTFTVTWCDFV